MDFRPTLPVRKVESCAAETVLLEGSAFYDAQERMRTFLRSTDPEHWLYNFRAAAGLDTRGARPLTGWESPEGLLRGHSTGHYLSALALSFRATGDEECRQKARCVVEGFDACQSAFARRAGFHRGFLSAYSEEQFDLLERYTPYPKIWAPYYTLHKILAGLLDAWRWAGIEDAMEIAEGIGDWVAARLARLGREQREKMWSLYIAGEYGGLNESMAELYRLTGKEAYLTAARAFDNERLFRPLLRHADELDGMHANQHIPQVLGAVKLYELTGETRYLEVAQRFWQAAALHHAYVFGGVGEDEKFHAPDRIAGLLTEKTAETCATYNMLKLTKALYRLAPERSYMDYAERALFNHALTFCDDRPTGGSTYFLSMLPGAVRSFDLLENNCCRGTGMESAFRYAESACFQNGGGLDVNLYFPLRVSAEVCTLTLHAERDEPERARLTVEPKENAAFTLRLRVPSWSGNPALTINGIPERVTLENGYITLRRRWAERTELALEFPCAPRYEAAPDDPSVGALCCGPYVLAAVTDSPERLSLRAERPEETLEREDGLAFRCRENGIRFVPMCTLGGKKYQMYFLHGQGTNKCYTTNGVNK